MNETKSSIFFASVLVCSKLEYVFKKKISENCFSNVCDNKMMKFRHNAWIAFIKSMNLCEIWATNTNCELRTVNSWWWWRTLPSTSTNIIISTPKLWAKTMEFYTTKEKDERKAFGVNLWLKQSFEISNYVITFTSRHSIAFRALTKAHTHTNRTEPNRTQHTRDMVKRRERGTISFIWKAFFRMNANRNDCVKCFSSLRQKINVIN